MPKRSLILAGGGLKVAFQAGVLQVLLDEAGLTFDHADGASGGTFNLAMYCQGMNGKQIADNWRNYEPLIGVDANFDGPGQFAHQLSYFTMDNIRKRVFPKWGLDWNKIRAGTRLGTFNLFNFSKKRLEVTPNSQMDEDKLVAAVSLPMWFPPVVINGDKYIDPVYITDANVQEAINRGADELWAIWTVSTRDEWRPGFVAQYFHIIETTADTNFFTMWDRIKKNNDEIAAGRPGEFGRTITQRLIQAEVPVHYLFNYSRDRMAEAVNQGVDAARAFCKQLGIALQSPPAPVPGPAPAKTSLQFTEDMRGFVGKGTDFQTGFDAGKAAKTKLDVHLTIRTEDVDEFVTNPQHQSPITGTVDSPVLGGKMTVDRGIFNLFVSDADPRKKEMRYRLFVKHANGTPHTVVGAKHIQDDKSQPEVWVDTTTLYTTVYQGSIEAGQEAGATQVAIGIISIHLLDFIRQLTTFRVQGPNVGAQLRAIAQFGDLFLGSLMQVYGGFLMPD